MAKKKVRRAKKASRAQRPTKATKKAAKAPKRKVAKKKKPAASRVAKSAGKATKKTPAKRKAAKRRAALGRARVPGTANLDQMFRNDYEARQVFEFLQVKTVKELEEHSADQIVNDLTAPLVKTVERIRRALAVNNRYLAGDQKYAVAFMKQIR